MTSKRLINSKYEHALLSLRAGLSLYAEAYKEEFGSPVGDDGVMGENFKDIATSLIGLLNGSTGSIDCRKFSETIHRLCKENEVELE